MKTNDTTKKAAARKMPTLSALFQKLAPKIGATVVIEPVWGLAGQVTFKNGKRVYFLRTSIDLNPLGSSRISKDKDYANFFMEKMGYRIIEGRVFFSKEFAKKLQSDANIDAAYEYAKHLGFPIIVKPNDGSQGTGVAVAHNKNELYRSMNAIFKLDHVALVQRKVQGKDYRIVVLDDRIISAYERIPLNVIGTGQATIRELLQAKINQRSAEQRGTNITVDEPRIKWKLGKQNMTLDFVLPKGQLVYLLDNANLSSGGDSVDVTSILHPSFQEMAIRLTKDMGLRICGVDVMVDGDISKPAADNYWILEINSAPGLDHYVKSGSEQEKIVEDLYLEVLKSMEAN
ncbi:MAG TPA: cyanophycin synthetase [Patescibacteria group bacterium]|jgi:D-alanine-D-alanine ligase-like ATP-grasp enzyme|nr:cyanophycin synthetase [Patescibacteria group bacterium]